METSTKGPHEGTKTKAAIYCRISRDRAGAGLGVDRQQADCRAVAERLGWEVVRVYVDNDISAYSGAPRPQYREMLDDVRAGRMEAVIAWHTDRLHRRATELEEFVTVAEAHGLQVQTVTAGSVDLTTASGRMVARMLGAAAQHEVDHARERMKRAKDQMAAEGKYRGGMRPYGFEGDGVTPREDEAQVIRSATKAVLAGRTLAALARELNETGLTTSTGKPWTYGRLRDVLTRPRNAGLLSRGRPDRDHFEIIGRAVWPAVVDEETWRAVHRLLSDPSRRKQDGNATRWLGSGIYTCGVRSEDGEVCGTTLRPAPYGGTPGNKNRLRRYLYRCTASAHLTISTKQTDEYVRGVVAELVRDPRVVRALTAGDGDASKADREQRVVLVRRLEQTEADYDDDLIDARRYRAKTQKITEEINEIDRRLADAAQQAASSSVLASPDPGAAFLAAPIDVQRAVLVAVLRVEVIPTPIRGAAWSSKRVRLSPVAGEVTS